MKKVLIFLALLILLFSLILAHELQTEVILGNFAVRIEVFYPGGEPVSSAPFVVYLPGLAREEYQKGQTDRNGCFAFVPDRPGVWTAVVDDQLGHRKSLSISVPENSAIFLDKKDAPEAAPDRIYEARTSG